MLTNQESCFWTITPNVTHLKTDTCEWRGRESITFFTFSLWATISNPSENSFATHSTLMFSIVEPKYLPVTQTDPQLFILNKAIYFSSNPGENKFYIHKSRNPGVQAQKLKSTWSKPGSQSQVFKPTKSQLNHLTPDTQVQEVISRTSTPGSETKELKTF